MDERIHELQHTSGQTASGTQRELIELLGMDQREVNALVRKRRKSARGWMLRSVAQSGYVPKAWSRRNGKGTAKVQGTGGKA